MRGHAERGCFGREATEGLHMALCREGVGFSTVPGPSRIEIDREGRKLRGMPEFEGDGHIR